MKLIKIFSNNDKFKNIEFNERFNVIIGKISDRSKSDKDTHNLGKSLLISIIDFILLQKNIYNKSSIYGKITFTDYIFYGELLLNSGKFLIIKRGVENPTKISFKLNDHKLQDFRIDFKWDKENIPIEEAIGILNDYLNFDVLENWNYRKTITYLLRSQHDYLDVFKLNKFKGKDKDWKPMVFDLLGFNGNLIKEKAEFEENQKAYENEIDILKNEAQIDISDKDKFQGLLDIKRDEKNKTEEKIDKFNFYEKDKEINHELVENVDYSIQRLNTERYAITYEIDTISHSLSANSESFNINEIRQIFEEVKIFFPNDLIKSYNDLLSFNRSITNERRKYLIENLNILKEDALRIDKELNDLELKKEQLLEYLTDKDSYLKFKQSQKQLSKIEAEILHLEDKLKSIDNASNIEIKIEGIRHSLEIMTKEIKMEIESLKHTEIRKIFNSIISEILNVPAILSLSQNRQGNVEFDARIQNPKDFVITAQDFGNTYRKLLCMAFDLSILIHYSQKSFYRFVYHDGALEGLDDRKKNKLISLIRKICKEYNLQYILTLIDSDLPKNERYETIQFQLSEICLELHDRDDSGKLFGISF